MTSRMIYPPAALAVTIEDARETLRLDDDRLDASLANWIRGITMKAEHDNGRAFITQQWRLTLDQFAPALRLERAPLVSVQSVRYYDAANVLQTLDPADYVVDTVSEPGYVVPAPGKAWPATFGRINSVMVDYTVGYGDGPDAMPHAVRLFILASLAEMFDPATSELKQTPRSSFLNGLMDGFKVYA